MGDMGLGAPGGVDLRCDGCPRDTKYCWRSSSSRVLMVYRSAFRVAGSALSMLLTEERVPEELIELDIVGSVVKSRYFVC